MAKTKNKYKPIFLAGAISIPTLIILFLLLLIAERTMAAPMYRPERERRVTNTDTYELIIQKNSQIDLNTVAGERIVDNAYPAVILEGGIEKPLTIDFRNTIRFSVKNALGHGNGFHYQSPDCEWLISTYPTEPYITIDLTYINATKKPVTVIGLSPLGIGNLGKGGVHLGPDSTDAWVLRSATLDDPVARIGRQAEDSPGHLAAYLPSSGRVFLAGFLTDSAASGRVTLSRRPSTPGGYFDIFSSVCIFNSPVVVMPGERLTAETLYLAVVENNPEAALERFTAAARAVEPNPAPLQGAPASPAGISSGTLLDWALASRQYYVPASDRLAPAPWSDEVARSTGPFDDNQYITVLTLAAMQGGLSPLPESGPAPSPLRRHILSRLLPAPSASGRPIDLFQEGPPRQWYLPLKTKAGEWTIVALFNWDKDAPIELHTPLPAVGLNEDNRYTVYDFWAGKYLGLIERVLRVEVPPEGVRLLGLRHFGKHPMLVASDRHFSQGASDHRALAWSYDTQTLSGAFESAEGGVCKLTVLIPEPYTLKRLTASADVATQSQSGEVLEFTLHMKSAGPVQWTLAF